MSNAKRRFTKATHGKRLKEGRGQGDGAHYKPYIRVQDFSSRGQSNRDFGLTAERQHDLFSKLEHRVYLIFDNSSLYDIKEQYPLPLEISLEIAQQCGIRHPADSWTKEPIPLTLDLLLAIPLPIGSKRFARSIKYRRDLNRPRVIEKLELERRCCQRVNIAWGIITELDVDPVLVRNLLWAYKFRRTDSLYPLSPDEVRAGSRALTGIVLAGVLPLCDAALLCDQLLKFRKGTCLRLARHLIASRQWRVNLFSPITTTERLTLLHASLSLDEKTHIV
jgi:hypothetical protein